MINEKLGNISPVQKNALKIVRKILKDLFFLIENMLEYANMKEKNIIIIQSS